MSVMKSKVFIDSNIWVYMFTEDEQKSQSAKEFIKQCVDEDHIVISYQVINEVCYVLRKNKFTEADIKKVARYMMGICEIVAFGSEEVLFASELRDMLSLSYWDSLIVSSSLLAKCVVLASEDMQDGLRIGDMVVRNVLIRR